MEKCYVLHSYMHSDITYLRYWNRVRSVVEKIGRVFFFLQAYGPCSIYLLSRACNLQHETFFHRARHLFVTLLLFLGSSTSRIVNNLSTQEQTMIIPVKNIHLFNRMKKKLQYFAVPYNFINRWLIFNLVQYPRT